MLEDAFLKCCRLSEDGKALVETDMRAHMNPTRMEVIKELANSFAKRLATPCPLCYNPGWGVVDTQKGLECELCRSETEMVKSEVFGCPKCLHKENRPRQDGLTLADPQYCQSNEIQKIIPHICLTYNKSLELAFQKISQNEVISSWMDSWEIRGTNPNIEDYIQVPHEGCLKDERRVAVKDSKAAAIERVWRIGGK